MSKKKERGPRESCGQKNMLLTKRCYELKAEVQTLNAQLADEQALRKKLNRDAELLTAENNSLADRISELEKHLEELEAWEEIPPTDPKIEIGVGYDLVRDQLADFALKIIQGQVGIVHREA